MEKLNEEQRKLIEDNYYLIFYFYSRYFGSLLDNEEYIGIAHIALCRAALNYDREKGKFGTHLYWNLKSEISHYFIDMNREKRKTNQLTISLNTPIDDQCPYGKPQTDKVARGSGNREYGCQRLG